MEGFLGTMSLKRSVCLPMKAGRLSGSLLRNMDGTMYSLKGQSSPLPTSDIDEQKSNQEKIKIRTLKTVGRGTRFSKQ